MAEINVITKMDWKQALRALKYKQIKVSAPGFFEASGGYRMKLIAWSDTTANGLTKCIIDWINFNGNYANRSIARGKQEKSALGLLSEATRITYILIHAQQIKLQLIFMQSLAGAR